MRHNGGRREGCVGGGGEGGGEGGGGDGGGDEEPSKLRAEKVGWCDLSTEWSPLSSLGASQI